MSIFRRGWSAQDVGATLGSFASDAAVEIARCDIDWFEEHQSAEFLVGRYTGAAVWMFCDALPAFHGLICPDPKDSLDAFRLHHFAWLVGSGVDVSDDELWSQMYEDAEAFGAALASPETRSSGQPMARIAKDWFAQRAPLPLFDELPTKSAIHLVSATGQLHLAVTKLVERIGGR